MIIKKKNPEKDTIKPLVKIRPIISPEGEILQDSAISEDCELYKWSDVKQAKFLIDMDHPNIRISSDDRGRLYAPLDPFKTKEEKEKSGIKGRQQLARTLLFAFDDCKYPIEHYKNLEVDHIDPSVPLDNSINNLRWVSHDENMYYAGESGVMIKKYNKNLSNTICQLLVEGKDINDIAKEVGVPRSFVYDIKRGASHKSVSSKYIGKGEFKEYLKAKPKKPREERKKQAEQVCKLLEEGYSEEQVSKITGASTGLIASIIKGASFKDVSCNYHIENRKIYCGKNRNCKYSNKSAFDPEAKDINKYLKK